MGRNDVETRWSRGSRRIGAIDQEAAALWLVAQHVEWLQRSLLATLDESRPPALLAYQSYVRTALLSYARAQQPIEAIERVLYFCHARAAALEALTPLAQLDRVGLVGEERKDLIEARIADTARFLDFLIGRATQAALLARLADGVDASKSSASRAPTRPLSIAERALATERTRRRLRIAPLPRDLPNANDVTTTDA